MEQETYLQYNATKIKTTKSGFGTSTCLITFSCNCIIIIYFVSKKNTRRYISDLIMLNKDTEPLFQLTNCTLPYTKICLLQIYNMFILNVSLHEGVK